MVRRLLGCVAISVILTILTAVLAPAGWFERLDGVLSDLAYPRGAADEGVAVVGIDARSLAEVEPQWPWPRQRYAELVERLGDAGAEVVVLDLVLSATSDTDETLVAAMQEQPTVLAAAPGVATSRAGEPVRVGRIVAPNATVAAAAAAVGHAQVVADPVDGIVRRVPVVVEDDDGQIVPSLALAALATRDQLDARPILRRPDGAQLGDVVIPTDDRYQLRVSWPEGVPPSSALPGPVLSAAEVLRGDVDDELVRGKVVFVGVTDPTLGDQLTTPVTKRVTDPGVMVQAAAFHTMTSRQFVVGPDTAETLVWVALLSLLTALAVQFLPLAAASVSSVVLLGGAVVLPVERTASGTLLHSVYPALAVALAAVMSGSLRYTAETRLRRRVSSLFARYVPPQVAGELVREGRLDEAVEGQRLEVTVFFCDLRGFTRLAASLEPAQVNLVLSNYYEYVSEMVFDAGGTIIQYVGDEVFAVFGAPVPRPDHAAAALRCALAVQAERERLGRELREDGLPMAEFGIGINTGTVVAAHAGSSFRRQYAVVGDPVNVGARLCAEAAIGQVVASAVTLDQIDDPPDGGVVFHPALKGVDRDVEARRYTPELDG